MESGLSGSLPKRRFGFVFCSILIFLVGWVMVFNTSSAEVLHRFLDKDTHFAAIKQLTAGTIGVILGFITYRLGYRWVWKIGPLVFWSCCFLLAIVLIPGVGQLINGARRWVYFAGFSLQPSEIAKYVLPFACVYELSQVKNLTFALFLQKMVKLCIPVALVLLQPDNASVFVLLMGMGAALFIMRIDLKYWLVPMLAIGLLGIAIASQMPHVPARIRTYLNPEQDLLGKGHQPFQAKIATGSGGLFGRGIGRSLQKLEYLPEAQNDYIAAIYAEEFGFIGVLMLLGTYLVIALCGFRIALFATSRVGFQLAASLLFVFLIQVFLNLGVVCGLVPSTGMNLPFFSQGGTSLIIHGILLGFLMSVEGLAPEISAKDEKSACLRWIKSKKKPKVAE